MKLKLIALLLPVILFSCKTNTSEKKEEVEKQNPKSIKSYNYSSLEPLLHKNDGKTYVVNFWATWCKPCVDELPYFEKLNDNYKNQNVEVLLVSLDFPNQVESDLLPFIENNNIKSHVVLFDDPNQNEWINKIDKSWSGALPATLIYNKNQRKFFEKPFDYQTLENELKQFIN
ncbi:TlpA family protein disulfide reductase [Tenacibaculum sp. IB213877]|uniref:TlpA family protein disulfide reductase n=1 Tax=Tenacibaculum sp. IB213877 TaxID=3097351 RepID=UPI002A5A9ACA|nr:TlpA family protein disulfide reductase [Tenacibaculum sp. IB213877]MDY0781076.1 TlpA family protein disulfide reductase [Tenacibaculum sp. IB213877]